MFRGLVGRFLLNGVKEIVVIVVSAARDETGKFVVVPVDNLCKNWRWHLWLNEVRKEM